MLIPRQNQKKVFFVETSPQAFGFDAVLATYLIRPH